VLVVEDGALRASIWDPVRIGVRYLKGLREKIGNAISAARQTDGPFASEYDL
jgi:error-prone DNA polymerase